MKSLQPPSSLKHFLTIIPTDPMKDISWVSPHSDWLILQQNQQQQQSLYPKFLGSAIWILFLHSTSLGAK